ncbi:Hydroxyacylglutathione hydrolase GloB [Asticcacaulis sp. MM231]
MSLIIDTFPALQDNYGFLLKDETSGQVAIIDAPEPRAITERLNTLGWDQLDHILNTHWHPDHTGGNALLKKRFGATIHGPQEVTRIAPLDEVLKPGDVFMLGETRLEVIDLGGHTLGHIGYVDRTGGNSFIADTLFPLGCGRLFEGTQEQMWASLQRIADLPEETILYSAHEYTMSNLKFAEKFLEKTPLWPHAPPRSVPCVTAANRPSRRPWLRKRRPIRFWSIRYGKRILPRRLRNLASCARQKTGFSVRRLCSWPTPH